MSFNTFWSGFVGYAKVTCLNSIFPFISSGNVLPCCADLNGLNFDSVSNVLKTEANAFFAFG